MNNFLTSCFATIVSRGTLTFSMSGSSVHVRVIPLKGTFTIEVQDSGLGMSEDDNRKVFNRGMKLSAPHRE